MSPLLALLAFQAAVVDPAKEPALAKPITVHLALASLKSVVAAMSKESGRPLDVAGSVSDLKATVLVKALPAGRTMEALADALGLVWKREGDLLRLARPEGGAAAESAYVAFERAAKVKSMTVDATGPEMQGPIRRRGGRPVRGGMALPVEQPAGAVVLRFDPTLLAVEGGEIPPPTRLDPAAPQGDSPFAKAVAAWPGVPEKVDAAWQVPVVPRLGKSTWEGGRYASGDLLVAWHDASGLPVVADAFRLPTRTPAFNPGSALAVLQDVAANDGLALRLADGVARLRHPAFWRLREQETPEGTWSAVERGVPTIDALASFAARLTAAQAAAFRSAEPPLSRVRIGAVGDSYPALLLWNVLPSAARKALLNDAPVGLATVRNATGAYLFALREAPFYHAGNPSEALAMPAAQLGIFGKTTPKAVQLRLSGERGGGVTYFVNLQ